MKMTKLVFMMLAVLTIVMAQGGPKAHAGYCLITTTYDGSSDTSSLRGTLVTVKTNTPGCHLGSSFNDAKHFGQGVIFETPELSSVGRVKTITLGSRIEVKSNSTLVIGNPSLRSITDPSVDLVDSKDQAEAPYNDSFLADVLGPLYPGSLGLTFYGYTQEFVEKYFISDFRNNTLKEYGHVVLNASQIDGEPFKCLSGAKPVFLRNLVLITNGYTKSEIFDDTGDSGCLRDAGAVRVCNTATHSYNPDLDPFVGSSNFLGAPWCRRNLTPTFKPAPGIGGKKGDCEEEDKITWYPDKDGDGYGRGKTMPNDRISDCDQPEGFVDNYLDCDDTKAERNPAATEICSDNIDNNCNHVKDCADDACSSDSVCSGSVTTETECADTLDNDADGSIDCSDADCQGDSACMGNDTETNCTDGVDNDADGALDCADSDCDDDASCNVIPPDPDPLTESICDDGVDNDADGAIDCADTECAGDAACADVDNDADGETPTQGDCDDTNADINTSATEICADDTDNNCDGIIDETGCVDPAIIDPPVPVPTGGNNLEGGSCSCNLNAKAPAMPQQMLLLALLVAPIGFIFWLRKRASVS